MNKSSLYGKVFRTSSLAIGLGVALMLAGCEQRRFVTVPVSGRITFEGKPTEGVHVSFQPEGGGPASAGITDQEGRYTLRRIDTQQPGAIVGAHRVYFSLVAENVSQDDAGRPLKSRLPEKYRKGMISFTVPPGGTDQADFHLTSRP